jgi:hypothetical protein
LDGEGEEGKASRTEEDRTPHGSHHPCYCNDESNEPLYATRIGSGVLDLGQDGESTAQASTFRAGHRNRGFEVDGRRRIDGFDIGIIGALVFDGGPRRGKWPFFFLEGIICGRCSGLLAILRVMVLTRLVHLYSAAEDIPQHLYADRGAKVKAEEEEMKKDEVH